MYLKVFKSRVESFQISSWKFSNLSWKFLNLELKIFKSKLKVFKYELKVFKSKLKAFKSELKVYIYMEKFEKKKLTVSCRLLGRVGSAARTRQLGFLQDMMRL